MRLLQQTRLCLFAMNRHDPSKLHDCSPSRHDPSKLHDVRRTNMTLSSFMTVPNSHEQVYIKTTPSLILTYKFTYIHSFHFIRERDRVRQTVRFDSQQTKCVLIVGRSFHPGRQIDKDSKHHYEGNNCLKEIVSNTRLDLQTGSDFSGFFPANRVKCSSAT